MAHATEFLDAPPSPLPSPGGTGSTERSLLTPLRTWSPVSCHGYPRDAMFQRTPVCLDPVSHRWRLEPHLYGVMRIVNLAHGTLYAMGAYVAAWLVGRGAAAGLPPWILLALLPLGAVAVGLVGAVLEPTLLRPLYQRA